MTIRKKQRLSLAAIHEGMIVAEPVFFEEDRPVFFSEGSIVTARLIRWLKRAGQMELSVYVEEQPVVPKEAAGRTYQLLLGGMQDIFQSLRKGAALQDGQVKQLAEKALAAVHQPDIFHVLNLAGQYDEDLIVHSLHVGMLSGLLALWSKFDAERVKAALMAGLLHDIGKIRVPERILKKQDPLLPHELSVFKGYPFYSFQMLQGNDLPEKVLEGVLYHRERLDGSGYPERREGNDIPMEAQIVAVVDEYVTLCSRTGNGAVLAALAMILEEMHIRLNPVLCLTLVERLKEMLIGADVTLGDDRNGNIIQFSKLLTLRPLIKLAGSDEYIDLEVESQLEFSLTGDVARFWTNQEKNS